MRTHPSEAEDGSDGAPEEELSPALLCAFLLLLRPSPACLARTQATPKYSDSHARVESSLSAWTVSPHTREVQVETGGMCAAEPWLGEDSGERAPGRPSS